MLCYMQLTVSGAKRYSTGTITSPTFLQCAHILMVNQVQQKTNSLAAVRYIKSKVFCLVGIFNAPHLV